MDFTELSRSQTLKSRHGSKAIWIPPIHPKYYSVFGHMGFESQNANMTPQKIQKMEKCALVWGTLCRLVLEGNQTETKHLEKP